MADIRPFAAVRPAKGLEAEIAALPYDVYSRAEARSFVEKHPGSFLSIDRAETMLPEGIDIYAPEVYALASSRLQEWIREGRFVQDASPCYYVYAQDMGDRTQTGIVACASIDDYLNNVIKKHENTRADKEQDRISHVDACSAQTGPIFLCYRKSDVIEEIVKKAVASEPVCDFFSEGNSLSEENISSEDNISSEGNILSKGNHLSKGNVRNRVWVISDPEDCARIRDAFADMDSIYIADGHHRCASAVRVGQRRRQQNPGFTGEEEFNFFLSVLFPENQLKIMDYNRVVHDLGGLMPEEFLEKAAQICEIAGNNTAAVPVPAKKGEIGLYLDGRWRLLRIRPEYQSDDPVAGLDVSILQDRILSPILGIEDPKTDSRIEFVGGIRGTKELEKRADATHGAAFLMYPTSIKELFDVADAGRLMPPKSTWFEPKLLSGLFIHLI